MNSRIRSIVIWSIIVLSILLSHATYAEEQNVAPDINKHFQHPDYATWVARFERPGRDVYDQRERIMRSLDIHKGMAIADIGAGTGLFTRLFAYAVGKEGKVYAIDPAKTFIDQIMYQARTHALTNVEGIVNTQKTTGLPDDSIDMAFVCATYHHFEYPGSMLKSIHRALHPGGQLVVIDFRKIPGKSSRWVMGHTRANRQTVIQEIESEGFKPAGEYNFLRDNYFLKFVRR